MNDLNAEVPRESESFDVDPFSSVMGILDTGSLAAYYAENICEDALALSWMRAPRYFWSIPCLECELLHRLYDPAPEYPKITNHALTYVKSDAFLHSKVGYYI